MRTAAGAALREVPLFAGLGDDEIESLAAVAARRRYAKGSILFHEGDPGDHLLVLLSGRAKVVLQSDRGQEVILSVVEPPDVIGHVALLDGAPRSATVVALDAVEARRLEREPFLDLVGRDRRLLVGLLKHLAACLRDTNEQIRTTLMYDIRGQVLRALIVRATDAGDDHLVVRPKPTHEEIAHMIGKARETVSRAVTQLRERGYLVAQDDAFLLEKGKLGRYWHA